MKKKIYLFGEILFLILSVFSCASNTNTEKTGEIKEMEISKNVWKGINNSNPLSSNVFCADPTAVEYEERLYVYGTNDHQQYLNAEKNTYEKIKSLVCFSTDDMVNWTYHGEINVNMIAPWIVASWAPSICSRVEEDGLTHFYLYFSNSGCGVGVITSTSPTGPWSDPLGHSLVSGSTKGLKDCPTPFDPGVCIDENGTGWLSFGAGIAKNGSKAMPGCARIVKLGKDMISFDSDFVEIKAPYIFEASELNYVNGTYVYTFNNSWEQRTEWPIKGVEPSSACSMSYMTTKTPLVSDSWEYRGHYFKNPGEMGLNYSNNHTHYEKYMGQWYLFYHTLTLQEKAPTEGGFRSLCVDKLNMNEAEVKIGMTEGTRKGVSAIKNLNPFEEVRGTTIFTSADIWYEDSIKPKAIGSRAEKDGAWIMVKNVDFNAGASKISAVAKGSDYIEIRLDNINSAAVATFQVDNEEYKEISADFVTQISGVHDVYILFASKGTCLQSWKIK